MAEHPTPLTRDVVDRVANLVTTDANIWRTARIEAERLGLGSFDVRAVEMIAAWLAWQLDARPPPVELCPRCTEETVSATCGTCHRNDELGAVIAWLARGLQRHDYDDRAVKVVQQILDGLKVGAHWRGDGVG